MITKRLMIEPISRSCSNSAVTMASASPTATLIKCKELHKASWRHPRSRWHQLDLVITRRADLRSVLHTRSYHSADCDTDHSLIASKVRLKPRKIHHGKTKGCPRINSCGTSNPVKAQSFAENLQQPATPMPNGLISAMPSTTQPWLHLARKNARMLTGLMLARKKCSQSRRPRGKRCWLTSRTLPQAHVSSKFALVTLTRLQSLASQVYPESKCGFRAERATVDMIFSLELRQLQEKCREQQQPLFLTFVHLTKAFDLVNRSGLFKIPQKIGCPPKFLAIITSFHQDMQSTVCFDGATSNAFPVSSGVKQGCVLAPTLFGIFLSMLLQYAFVDCTEGVYIRTRSDGKLFNIARLCAKTKAYVVLIR